MLHHHLEILFPWLSMLEFHYALVTIWSYGILMNGSWYWKCQSLWVWRPEFQTWLCGLWWSPFSLWRLGFLICEIRGLGDWALEFPTSLSQSSHNFSFSSLRFSDVTFPERSSQITKQRVRVHTLKMCFRVRWMLLLLPENLPPGSPPSTLSISLLGLVVFIALTVI